MSPRDIITPGEPAPDFKLADTTGKTYQLSHYLGRKPVVLAFLRGFM